MKKSLSLLKKGFVSSSGTTPQFLAFYRTFKSELTAQLKKVGATQIQVGKGHFYCSGFFTAKSGQIYYFSLSDVRSFDGQMMYRTAKDYKDYTGGSNQWVPFTEDMVSNMRLK